MTTMDSLRRAFRHFAEMTRGSAPLYAALASRIADEPDVLALATRSTPRQPPVNLLLGAVHYLLLGGARHPLASFYPSVGGTEAPEAAFGPFVDFCRRHEDEIVALVGSRRVQTNEVGRCGLLLPALLFAWRRSGSRPLHLLEFGASAGLNLVFDRYRYDYGTGTLLGEGAGPLIRTEPRGGGFPVPEGWPDVASRTGIDVAPVDVTDADAVRWLEALIWPDHVQRIRVLREAVAVAREDPPRVVRGDGIQLLPHLVASLPEDGLPCVFHSYATYQLDRERRAELDATLEELHRRRPLARVSVEWLGDDPGPRVLITYGTGGERRTVHVADAHHHGAWIRWSATADGSEEVDMERLVLLLGDLVEQSVDAIVNAANASLEPGGGVCGAIHRAAGPELAEECRGQAPCPVGSARLTRGHGLRARHVIHAVGPVYRGGSHGEREALASAYRESLRLAAENGLATIAFPAISTGIYGYPVREAAEVALKTIREWVAHESLPEQVRVVLFTEADRKVWAEEWARERAR